MLFWACALLWRRSFTYLVKPTANGCSEEENHHYNEQTAAAYFAIGGLSSYSVRVGKLFRFAVFFAAMGAVSCFSAISVTVLLFA